MINHFRTLLINKSAAATALPNYYMEEYIPADFVPVTLPSYLQTVRNVLFGRSDRLMDNYRARQFVALAHNSELLEYVTALDNRITYWPMPPTLFQPRHIWSEQTVPGGSDGSETDLYFLGDVQETPDSVLHKVFDIWLLSDSAVRTSLRSALELATETEVVYESGMSQPIALPGTQWRYMFRQPSVSHPDGLGFRSVLETISAPKTTLGEVLANLSSLDEETLGYLFQIGSSAGESEPIKTFRNCFYEHYNCINRLSAALLAYVYRVEAVRNERQ